MILAGHEFPVLGYLNEVKEDEEKETTESTDEEEVDGRLGVT